MNASAVKSHCSLARLHLGCGESLSLLLQEQTVVQPKTVPAQAAVNKPQPKPGRKQ